MRIKNSQSLGEALNIMTNDFQTGAISNKNTKPFINNVRAIQKSKVS